jgi:hypothetical protein
MMSGVKKVPTWARSLRAKDFPFDSQTAALVVVQQDASLAEFFSKYLILGAEAIVDLLLLVVDQPVRMRWSKCQG